MAQTDWTIVYQDMGGVVYGLFAIKDDHGYAEFIELSDLDGGAGATGMVLVERGTIGVYASTIGAARKRITDAMTTCDMSTIRGPGFTRAERRMRTWQALRSGDGGDVASSTVIQTDTDGPMQSQGWKAELVLDGGAAVAAWLVETYGIPMPAAHA